jgi:hypothetical protein
MVALETVIRLPSPNHTPEEEEEEEWVHCLRRFWYL